MLNKKMNKNSDKNIARWAGVLAISFIIGLSLSYAFAAWQAPSSNIPPNDNEPAFLNIGAVSQLKSGGLEIEGLFTTDNATNLAVLGGNVGIGTTTPPEKLTLEGGNFLQHLELISDSSGIKYLKDSTYMDSANSLAIMGKTAYITGFTSNSFAVVDISNSNNPTRIASIVDSNNLYNPRAVAVAGQYVYVTVSCSDVPIVIDVSNPSNPQIKGGLIGSSWSSSNLYEPHDIYISGQYAYVTALCADSLLVIDLSNPISPQVVAGVRNTEYMDYPYSVFVLGNYAYVTGRTSDSLAIINITDPLNPVFVKGFKDPQASPNRLNSPQDVFVSGDYAYVAAYNYFTIINVANPETTNPSIEGYLGDNFYFSSSKAVKIKDDYAYVVSFESESMAVVDVSDKANPEIVGGYFNSLQTPYSVFVSGNNAYIASFDSNSLAVADITDPLNPQIIGRRGDQRMDGARSVYVFNQYAYIASYSSRELTVVDISTPTNPQIVESETNGSIGNLTDVYVSEPKQYAYITSSDNGKLFPVDISDPLNIIIKPSVSSSTMMNWPRSVFVSGDYAYVASSLSDSLIIYDITDPAVPVSKGAVASSTLLDSAREVFVAGDYAYVASANSTTGDNYNGSLAVINIQNKASPQIVGWYNGPEVSGATAVYVSGSYAYVTSQSSLAIIDVSVPTFVKEVTGLTNASSVFVAASKAYVLSQGWGAGKFYVIDVDLTNPSNPSILGTVNEYASFNGPQAVDISGDYAFVAVQDSDALTIINIFDKTQPVFANSISSYYLDSAQDVFVSGGYAYVTGAASRSLAKINISDVYDLSLTGIRNDNNLEGANRVFVSDNYAYVTAENAVTAVDISGDPSFAGKLALSGYARNSQDIEISGNYAYLVGNSSDSFAIADISNPINPKIIGGITDQTYLNGAKSVYVSHPYAYVSGEYSNSLAIIQISDPSNPQLVKGFKSSYLGSPRDIYVSGPNAYIVGNNNRLTVVNISNPSNPTVRGSLLDNTWLDEGGSIDVSGNYAYIAQNDWDGGTGRISIVDVSNLNNLWMPAKVADSKLDEAYDIKVLGGKAYFSLYRQDGLGIMDITGIDAPTASIGNISTSQMSVSENMDIGNNLYIRGGLNVGGGGIKSDGVIAATSTEAFRIKLPLSSSGTCGSSNAPAGSIYFKTTLNEPCYCNGSVWTQFDGGGGC